VLTALLSETMSWERELKVLNEAIRRLNGEYDAFLYGSATKPPIESRRHVEEMFRLLAASPPDAAAERYMFSALQGRFSSLCERWERLQAEKEAGRRPGVYGGFVAPIGAAATSAATETPNARRSGSVRDDRSAGESRDRELFEHYVAAKRGRGEDVAGYRLESFLARLDQEREKLKERIGPTEVEFEVVERDGRVKLVARPGGTKPKA